jgi:hypothetical protein
MGKSVAEFEEAVFGEWKEQPMTQQLIERELTRGRLRQKLNALQARIADWEKVAPTCPPDGAGQVTRKWMDGMMRHWREQAQEFEQQLQALG